MYTPRRTSEELRRILELRRSGASARHNNKSKYSRRVKHVKNRYKD